MLKAFLLLEIIFLFFPSLTFADHQCGNAICQPQGHHLETCSNCPADCGVCSPGTPQPTAAPTPSATNPPAPAPTSAPTQAPTQKPLTPSPIPNPGTSIPTALPTTISTIATTTPMPTTSPSLPSPSPAPTPAIEVSVSKIASNPVETVPVITGAVVQTKTLSATRVEVSLDAGETWFRAKLNELGKFSFDPETLNLEDGNYTILTRVIDSNGNITITDSQSVVVDRIPPTLGSGIVSLGAIILEPKEKLYQVAKNSNLTVTASTRGGVTKASIETDEKTYQMANIKGTNIWKVELQLNTVGITGTRIHLEDGANNKTSTTFAAFSVSPPGKANEKVTVYSYDDFSRDWVIWDGSTFGQNNPTNNEAGEFSFILPNGKYHLRLGNSFSDIFTLNELTLINPDMVNLEMKSFFKLIPMQFKVPKLTNLAIYDYLNPLIGKVFDLPSKHIVYVSSWSSESIEQLNNLPKESVAVGVDHTEEFVEVLKAQGNYNFNIVPDPTGILSNTLGISLLNTHVFTNDQKVVQNVYTGILTKEQIFNYMK